ncbi:S49 family peptidase [Burkholderia pseudomallei]|nr:S49 family peptidase [Burkholderia pseudomallei]
MKPHLRLASLIFNQPQLVTDPMMSLAVQWANQALNLNIINLTVNGAQPKIMEDGEFDSGAQMTFLTSMVQNSYKQFVDAIANFRGLSTQAVKDTQAGIFFGQKGVEAGLADSVETPQAAINRIAAEVRASRADRQGANARRSVSARAAAMNMQVTM